MTIYALLQQHFSDKSLRPEDAIIIDDFMYSLPH